MKVKTIYEGVDCQIDIALPLHYLLLEGKTPQFTLSESEKIILLSLVHSDLKKQGYKKNQNTKYFGTVPIIEPRTAIGFSPPFNIFELAINWLATYDNLDDEDYLAILTEIKELYSDMEGIEGIVYTAIFHTPIRNVKGYCAYITEKEIIILFWGFDDLKEKDIFD